MRKCVVNHNAMLRSGASPAGGANSSASQPTAATLLAAGSNSLLPPSLTGLGGSTPPGQTISTNSHVQQWLQNQLDMYGAGGKSQPTGDLPEPSPSEEESDDGTDVPRRFSEPIGLHKSKGFSAAAFLQSATAGDSLRRTAGSPPAKKVKKEAEDDEEVMVTNTTRRGAKNLLTSAGADNQG